MNMNWNEYKNTFKIIPSNGWKTGTTLKAPSSDHRQNPLTIIGMKYLI
jgi:hypothetical protein